MTMPTAPLLPNLTLDVLVLELRSAAGSLEIRAQYNGDGWNYLGIDTRDRKVKHAGRYLGSDWDTVVEFLNRFYTWREWRVTALHRAWSGRIERARKAI